MIRQGKITDLNRIMKIEKDAFSSDIVEKSTVYLERLNVFPQGFLVAEKQKILQGFFTTEIWEEKKLSPEDFLLGHSIKSSHNDNGSILYISSFALAKKVQGKGSGKKLFNSFLENILNKNTNINSIVLVVSNKWNKAQKIYKTYGFKKEFIIKNFFSENQDGIVMKLNI